MECFALEWECLAVFKNVLQTAWQAPGERVKEENALSLAGGSQHLQNQVNLGWLTKSQAPSNLGKFELIITKKSTFPSPLNSMLKMPPGEPTLTCSLLNLPSPWSSEDWTCSFHACGYLVVLDVIEGVLWMLKVRTKRPIPAWFVSLHKLCWVTDCELCLWPCYCVEPTIVAVHTLEEDWACPRPGSCWSYPPLPSSTSPSTSVPGNAGMCPS